MNERNGRITAAVAVTVTLFALVLTAVRWFFGVGYTDEALYAVMPYRFAMGARPFVDELLFQQTSVFLPYPFVKLFYMITGATTGVVLYMRVLATAFMAAVAATVWLSVRRVMGRWPALLFCLPALVFIYFNIPSLTYNTVGLGFLAVGCWLAFASLDGSGRGLAAAGAAHGLAVIAYPSLAVAVFVNAAVVAALTRRWRPAAIYVTGGLAIAGIAAVLFTLFGWANVLDAYARTSAVGIFGGGWQKAAGIGEAAWSDYSAGWLVIVGLTAVVAGHRRRPRAAAILLLGLPLAPLLIKDYPGYLNSVGYMSYYALFAPALYAVVRQQTAARRVFWLVWVPGFVAGLTTAYTSSNGWFAVAVGFFTAALATSMLLWLAMRELWRDKPGTLAALQLAILVIPVVALTAFQFGPLYLDDDIGALKSRTTFGGYYGLYTSPVKTAFLTKMKADLDNYSGGAKTILFYDNFPAGYLLTDLIPLTNYAWTGQMVKYPKADRKVMVTYYRQRGDYPDVIVQMNRIYYTAKFIQRLRYPAADPVNNLAHSARYRPVLKTRDYTIYRETNAD